MVLYPEEPLTGRAGEYVAHFAHPLELELLVDELPPASRWPCLLFKVCTLDRLDRYTVEGFGYVDLSQLNLGAAVHVVPTWRPMPSVSEAVQEMFLGGARELDGWDFVKGTALAKASAGPAPFLLLALFPVAPWCWPEFTRG